MKKQLVALLSGAMLIALATTVFAQSSDVKGEVKKIDRAQGKITLKHGPIKNLDMEDPMTMVLRVKEPKMLDGLNVGDQVNFEADRINGQITITKIQKAKR